MKCPPFVKGTIKNIYNNRNTINNNVINITTGNTKPVKNKTKQTHVKYSNFLNNKMNSDKSIKSSEKTFKVLILLFNSLV